VEACAEGGAKTSHSTWICILCPGQAFKHAALNMRPAASSPASPSNTSRNRAKGFEKKTH